MPKLTSKNLKSFKHCEIKIKKGFTVESRLKWYKTFEGPMKFFKYPLYINFGLNNRWKETRADRQT